MLMYSEMNQPSVAVAGSTCKENPQTYLWGRGSNQAGLPVFQSLTVLLQSSVSLGKAHLHPHIARVWEKEKRIRDHDKSQKPSFNHHFYFSLSNMHYDNNHNTTDSIDQIRSVDQGVHWNATRRTAERMWHCSAAFLHKGKWGHDRRDETTAL